MASGFLDFSFLEDKDDIRLADGGEPVRDDDDSSPA